MVQKYFFYNRFRGINAGTRSRLFFPRLCLKDSAKASLRSNARVRRGYLREEGLGVPYRSNSILTSTVPVFDFYSIVLNSRVLQLTVGPGGLIMCIICSWFFNRHFFKKTLAIMYKSMFCTMHSIGMSTPTVNRLPYWFLVIFEHSLTNILKVVVA
jgi:hypothetical protein